MTASLDIRGEPDEAALTQALSGVFGSMKDQVSGLLQTDPASAEAADDAPPRVLRELKTLSDAAIQPILIFDFSGRIRYSNRSFHALFKLCRAPDLASDIPGSIEDLLPEMVPSNAIALASAAGEWAGKIFLPLDDGRTLVLQLQLLRLGDVADGNFHFGAIFRDASKEHARGRELQRRNAELEQANAKFRDAQQQLVQTEKLASIGQLAAGVAHEINNPIGYVHSNLATLVSYTDQLLTLIEMYEGAVASGSSEKAVAEIREMRERFEFDYVRGDLPQLLAESREGVERVRKIVQDLKDFSRSEAMDAWAFVDIHRGLDSTLNIVWNELKYKAKIVKKYSELPTVQCIPSELNQVFLNMLLNAGQAIEQNGVITVSTAVEGDFVRISIGDDGVGIAEASLPKIFDPFFTTKAVGKGTGLGLSISYGIVKKHGGRIDVTSTLGKGTVFHIYIPIEQPPMDPK